jgi:hypothetical protein
MPDRIDQFNPVSKLYKSFIALLVVYSLFIFAYGIYGALTGSGDLKSFQKTSELLLHKKNPYELTINYIEQEGYNLSFAGLKKAGGISMYPPSTHILFIPFYAFLLSPDIACVSWLLWNIVFLGIIYWFVCSRYKSDIPEGYKHLFIFLLIGAASTKTNLSLGQTTLFSLAAFTLTLSFRDRNKWLSGLAFALAVSKPSLMILFVFYLLFKKEFRIIAIAFCIHLALTVGISIWIGQSPVVLMQNYFKVISLLTTQDNALSFYYQTAGVSLKTIMTILSSSQVAITLATVSLYVLAIMYIYRHRSLDEKRVLGLIALLTILVDYHQHYDFSILLFMFPVLCGGNHKKNLWLFIYFGFLLYMPNISRLNFFGFSTASFFKDNMPALLIWQSFYTGLYFLLLAFYIKEFIPFRRSTVQYKR